VDIIVVGTTEVDTKFAQLDEVQSPLTVTIVGIHDDATIVVVEIGAEEEQGPLKVDMLVLVTVVGGKNIGGSVVVSVNREHDFEGV
jgi:hypothetical protein